jgi:protein phosphatase
MLSQAQPFKMDQVHRRGARSISEWSYQPLTEHRPDLPRWLDLAIQKGCHPDLKQRQQAYSEFWNDLLKPNPVLIRSFKRRPLLQQNSGRVWQVISFGLLIVVIAQGYFLATG